MAQRIVINDFAGHAFTIDLADMLQRRGLDVHYAYCVSNVAPHGDIIRSTVDVRGIGSGGEFSKYSILRRLFSETWYGAGSAWHVIRCRPSVTIVTNMPLVSALMVWLASIAVRGKFVLWFQDAQAGLAANSLGTRDTAAKAIRLLENFLLRRSSRIIAISDQLASYAASAGAATDRITVLANWPALSGIALQPRFNGWTKDHGLDEKRCRFVYSGTLARKHDPDLLVRLADELSESDVIVVSEGEGASWLLDQQARSPRPNLFVFPYAPFSRVGEMLGSGDVLIALLTRDASRYSVPSKILSYLCAGRPTLASIPADNAASVMLTQVARAGVVIEPGDHAAFIEAARRLETDHLLRKQLGNNARSFAEANFDPDALADRFLLAADIRAT